MEKRRDEKKRERKKIIITAGQQVSRGVGLES
jgi:hypothetical protein